MKFAYFVVPHTGGTYTVYDSVRRGLAANDITVKWVGVGPNAKAAAESSTWQEQQRYGTVVAGDTDDDFAQARALVAHLDSQSYDGIFVNAACNRVQSNVLRYLDKRFVRIMTVHNTTVGTYAGARALRDFVNASICVSPRIHDDLVRHYGFPEERIYTIANGIDLSRFQLKRREPFARGEHLRLLFLGRIIDTDKGVFLLPRIMKRLKGQPITLSIAGDGPDLENLTRRCSSLGSVVRFLGRVSPSDVPEVMASHDALIFPSRFEGLGMSLVEAMATGCVPIASRLKGVTDFVIRDGVDGMLFEVGDSRGAATAVSRLTKDRQLLEDLSMSARRNVSGRFDLETMTNRYVTVIRNTIHSPGAIRPPLSLILDNWSYPTGLKPGLRTYLPTFLKNHLRVLRERLA